MMFKRVMTIVVVLLLGFSSLGIAAEVSQEIAQRVAENQLTHYVTIYGS